MFDCSAQAEHGKTYNNTRLETRRRAVFERNVRRVEAHNARPDVSYRLAINAFSDETRREFSATRNGLRGVQSSNMHVRHLEDVHIDSLPNQMDWREQGVVTPVKDQGGCGADWAFAAVGAVEAQTAIALHRLVPLSEQNLIDCAFVIYDNFGCFGGAMNHAYHYIRT